MKQSERNYSVTEKEALAVRDALVKFTHILEGKRNTIITDHSALTWATMFADKIKAKPRLSKWNLVFSAFDHKWVQRAGRVHSNVDPLSRLERKIPYFEQPAFNEPGIDLSNNDELDFYGRMRHKFKDRASSLFTDASEAWETFKDRLSTFLGLQEESSIYQGEIELATGDNIVVSYTAATQITTQIFIDPIEAENIKKGYLQDKHFQEMDNRPPWPFERTEEGLLMYQDPNGRKRLCIPSSMTKEIFGECHDSPLESAHAGFEKTYARLAESFYWPGMTEQIRKLIGSCDICQKIKHRRHAGYGLLQPIPIPNKPFSVVTMDFIGELPNSKGYNAIFVVVCKLTKYAFFIPCNTTLNSKQTARLFFDRVVTFAGLPRQIISDRDTRWRNDFWKEVCELYSSKRSLTAAYHPQADGQTEILNQTIEVALRSFTSKERGDWSIHLPYLAFAYNTTPHSATKYAPHFLLTGFPAEMPLDFLNPKPYIHRDPLDTITSTKASEFLYEIEAVRLSASDALLAAQQKFKKNYDKKHQPLSLKPGEKVLVNIQSLQLPESKGPGRVFTQLYDGPFEVLEQVTPVSYRIRIPHSYQIHPVISIAHLEKYKEAEPGDIRPKLKPLRDDPLEYEVEEIVAQKWGQWNGRRVQLYKCSWKGYGVTDEWIPLSYLRNAPEILRHWKQKLQDKRPQTSD